MRAETFNDTTRFISDTHFGHPSMLTKAARPFGSVDEMDRYMIQSWNAVVRRNDHVWHLGDFGFKATPQRLAQIFSQLNGIKHLIVGNHDSPDVVASPSFGWASIDHMKILKCNGAKLVLSHYPMREWPEYWHGALHLFGHTHSNLPSSNRALDVGVDNVGFAPLTFDQIQERLAELPDLSFRGAPAEPVGSEPGIAADEMDDAPAP